MTEDSNSSTSKDESSDLFSFSLSSLINESVNSDDNNMDYQYFYSDSTSCHNSVFDEKCSNNVEESTSCDSLTKCKTESISETQSCGEIVECESLDKIYEEMDYKYSQLKDKIVAIQETSYIMNFIYDNLEDSLPNIRIDETKCYKHNVDYIEKFVESVLCVASKNNMCGKLNIKICKHRKSSTLSDRHYTFTIIYSNIHVGTEEFDFLLEWTRIIENSQYSYVSIVRDLITRTKELYARLEATRCKVFF